MTAITQRSFAGGELSPSLYARVDTVKYQTGVRTLRNTFVRGEGGSANRPGSQFICEVKDSSKSVRLVEFEFSDEQTYILEFGDQYLRFIQDGAQVVEASKTITGATQANPCVITSTAHGYSNGDEVAISGVGGMSQLNGRNFRVAGVTANTFQLQYLDGTNVNSTTFTAYTSGGSAARVYEIDTPYLEADLQQIKLVQSADVMTLAHPSYAPRELARSGHTSWTLSEASFSPGTERPQNCEANGELGPGPFIYNRYRICAVSEEGEESYPGLGPTKTITGATKTNPVVITCASHGFGADSQKEEVYIDGVVGMTELNGRSFQITRLTSNTFQLDETDGTSFGTYVSGGTAARTYAYSVVMNEASPGNPWELWWDPVEGAREYNIYKQKNGVYGLIGIAAATNTTTSPFVDLAEVVTFSDVGTTPDVTDSHPIERRPVEGEGTYPAAVGYIQQRLALAGSDDEPEQIQVSQIARYKNFAIRHPIRDDDALTFKLAGRKVVRIKHIIELGRPIIFTSSAEISLLGGGSDGILLPGAINPKPHSGNGASDLAPLIVNETALYVQARGNVVRDLLFEVQTEGYRGNDLTTFSKHLFRKYTLVDWAYQGIPDSIVWAVRSDGVLLGLTYVREQAIVAWHRHDTDGFYESIAAVPEGTEDAVYVAVRRTINGATKRYIERIHTRLIDDIRDAVFMDCALSFDGRNSDAAHTMTLSGGTTWADTETLTLTSSAAFFTSADVGNQIHLTDAEGAPLRITIGAYTSATVVTGKPHKLVPASLRSTATSSWARAVDELTGLWHLEGKEVSIFADGNVIGSPYNPRYTTVYTVTNGSVTLPEPYAVVHVGLPYLSDLETLDIDMPQGESLADKKSAVDTVILHVEDSRGIWIGPAPPDDDEVDAVQNLMESEFRNEEGYDEPVSLKTDTQDLNILSSYGSKGRVFIRQVDPLPMAVSAITPKGLIPIGR